MTEDVKQTVMMEELKEEVANLAPFDPTKKKKKKKVVIQDSADGSMEPLAEKTESVSDGLELNFTGLKKKKKQTSLQYADKENANENTHSEGIVLEEQKHPLEGTDRDYPYQELIGRVYSRLLEHNPELNGERQKTVMRPPQVISVGRRKTMFVNFMNICKSMHRPPEHFMAYLLAELSTTGSLDGQQRLVMKGMFKEKNIGRLLQKYFSEYVICKACERKDTNLAKENRLFYVKCECGSSRSVAPVKAGFMAQV